VCQPCCRSCSWIHSNNNELAAGSWCCTESEMVSSPYLLQPTLNQFPSAPEDLKRDMCRFSAIQSDLLSMCNPAVEQGGSALFRQAVFWQALFRQGVFQYGTIPPTRLFNYQFLILVYKQMFTITFCYQYAETILFRLNPSATSVSGITSGSRSNLKVGGTWRARSASV